MQKEDIFIKAERMANLTYLIIAKSCNKILIGKTFWKSVALPGVLYGSSVVNFTKTDIAKLQRLENSI